MQLPVRQKSFAGLQSFCFTHGLQFGTRTHAPLMQSPVKHGSIVGEQSSCMTQGPPLLDELDVIEGQFSQVQPGE